MTCREFIENYDYIVESYNELYEKRYLGSTLRYAGGKSGGVEQIAEYIPKDITKVISPFFGGGSMEIYIAKELGIDVVGYDIFPLLVNFWQMQIHSPNELYEELKKLPNTKKEYARIKGILKFHYNKGDIYEDYNGTDLELAAYYWFNHQLSYGPQFLGHMSNMWLDEKKYQRAIEKVKNFDVKNLEVYQGTFDIQIPKYNGEFMYLDPPYYLGEDSTVFRGIYPNSQSPIYHKKFDHEKLADLLKQHEGGFVLSYNDCSWIRNAYKNFEIIELTWQYSMGQGITNVSKGRIKQEMTSHIKKSSELLIIGRVSKG